MSRKCVLVAAAMLCASAVVALANGGPFVIKYPNGDPAAKGILARIDPSLRPAQETRLKVVKEQLGLAFETPEYGGPDVDAPPVAYVSAVYTIQNPTDQQIDIDFGFPILRGIYMNPWSMVPQPEVKVTVGDKPAELKIISNSAIYGIIRQRARQTIDAAVQKEATLSKLVDHVRAADTFALESASTALTNYLVKKLHWNDRDAALMVAYASVNMARSGLSFSIGDPLQGPFVGGNVRDKELSELIRANLGPFGAIGEQKATQLSAQLASKFDRKAASTYEGIFEAWGGDVRERSVDLATGKVRPREIVLDPKLAPRIENGRRVYRAPSNAVESLVLTDPTIYARVDYLDPNANINDRERAACKSVLKNLPVVFTFAPMNLLYYRAAFPARSTQVVAVTYKQYPYLDTRDQPSYQLAYVLHPASLWKSFGPIDLEVVVPDGVKIASSVPCESAGVEDRTLSGHILVGTASSIKARCSVYKTTLEDKTGELFVAVDAASWKAATVRPEAKTQQAQR
jgi:hypothetical protein